MNDFDNLIYDKLVALFMLEEDKSYEFVGLTFSDGLTHQIKTGKFRGISLSPCPKILDAVSQENNGMKRETISLTRTILGTNNFNTGYWMRENEIWSRKEFAYYEIPMDGYLKSYLYVCFTKEKKLENAENEKAVLKQILDEIEKIFLGVVLYPTYSTGYKVQKKEKIKYGIPFELSEDVKLPPKIINLVKAFQSKENNNNDNILNQLKTSSIAKKTSYRKTSTSQKKQEKTRTTDFFSVDIEKIIQEVSEKLIGQEQAIEMIAYNILANQKVIACGNKDLFLPQKSFILLDGSTGTGKTAMIKMLAEKFSLPVVIEDSQNFSSTGYSGRSLTDILVRLLDATDGDVELAKKGIVCLDEIDKLAGTSKDRELTMKREIQKELLTFTSGHTFVVQYQGENIEFDTSALTVICMGAFTSLREDKIEENEKKKNRKVFGFANPNLEEEKTTENLNTYMITEDDYIAYGLERELVGRINTFISTKTYTVSDLENILTKSTISPLKGFIEFGKMAGVKIEYEDSFIHEVAIRAYELKTGARALEAVMHDVRNILLKPILTGESKEITLVPELLKEAEKLSIRRY